MSNIFVATEKPGMPETEYVRVTVFRGTDGDIWGDWMRLAEQGDREVTIHQATKPQPIADTWADAMAYAQSNGLTWIYVDDTSRLFPVVAPTLGLKVPLDQVGHA